MQKFLLIVYIGLFVMGCSEDKKQIKPAEPYDFVDGSILNQELKTQQEIYEWADWNTRWEKSRQARRKYIELRHTHPDAALAAYIEYYNWMHYGHPLATKIATMSVEMDRFGETTIPELLEQLNLELQMKKDLVLSTKDEIEEVTQSIKFWTELREEIIANGGKVTDCKIAFEISEITMD